MSLVDRDFVAVPTYACNGPAVYCDTTPYEVKHTKSLAAHYADAIALDKLYCSTLVLRSFDTSVVGNIPRRASETLRVSYLSRGSKLRWRPI